MAGRPRIYKDDVLALKPMRISVKYEQEYVKEFIEILRKKPAIARAFVEKNKIRNVDK